MFFIFVDYILGKINTHRYKIDIELHTAYLNDLNQCTKQDKYFEIKQFFKVDIKQNNVSTVIC